MLGDFLMTPVAFATLTLVPGLMLAFAIIEAAFPGRLPQAINNLLSSILDVSDRSV